jgi:hypothetical protein
MKKFFLFFALMFSSSWAFGQACVASNTQSCTPNVQLALPFVNAPNWNVPLVQNFTLLDQLLSGNANLSALKFVNGTISGNIVFTGNLTAGNLNNVLFVDGVKYAQTGAGLAQAISDCLALPSCPMVEAPNVSGPVSSTITFSRPIRVSLCQAALTLNGNPGINMSSSGGSIHGCGQSVTVLTSGAANDLIQINADAEKLDNIDLEGNNLASIAIHVASGNFEKINRVFANGSSVAELQFEPTVGINSTISNSVFESNLTATPSIVINGNDGCGGGSAIPRHFTGIDTGGNPIDIKGASTVMLSNSSIGGITMTSAACKLFMTGVRELNNPVTFLGTNHTIVGNAFSGAITLDASLNNSVIGPNVSVGALVNNAAVTQNNTVIDNNTGNSFTMFPQLTVKTLLLSNTAPTISSGFGTSPSIVQQNGTAAFEINVGTGGAATSGVIGLPTATNGWTCTAVDMNTNIVTRETAFTTTSVTLTAASAWTASDKLLMQCGAF